MLNTRIKELRTARTLSQVQMAKLLGVTTQSVSNWENNNIQPSVDMLVMIARLFSYLPTIFYVWTIAKCLTSLVFLSSMWHISSKLWMICAANIKEHQTKSRNP